MEDTILSRFITELGIKHTTTFSDHLYRVHPHRNSLYGLSKMLSVYRIPNAGIHMKDKEVTRLSTPFIAHTANDFVIVKKASEQVVTYEWRGRDLTVGYEDFRNIWSGIVLLAEPDEDSIEPEFSKHLQTVWINRIGKGILGMSILIILSMSFINSFSDRNWGIIISMMLNFIGIGISYLLWMKQEKLHNGYADQICSLFHQKDCNHVLESPGAKIAGFSWSQIGLGYFISNTLLLIAFPAWIHYLAIINVMALPYTVWSIWYQYKVVNQWCVLCLIVQATLWLLFITNSICGYILIPTLETSPVLTVAIVYTTPVLIIHIASDIIRKANRLEIVTQELNSLKGHEDVFMALLKKEKYYPVDKSTSQIILGNSSAKFGVTILTNPHCAPCADMHKRITDMLKKAGDRFYVQYIFSSFTKELLVSNRFLIASYLQKEIEETEQIYAYWYERGKYEYKNYIPNFNLQLDDPEIDSELQKHSQWIQRSHLMSTPTVLINGYKLPDKYKIEDIMEFTNLDVN